MCFSLIILLIALAFLPSGAHLEFTKETQLTDLGRTPIAPHNTEGNSGPEACTLRICKPGEGATQLLASLHQPKEPGPLGWCGGAGGREHHCEGDRSSQEKHVDLTAVGCRQLGSQLTHLSHSPLPHISLGCFKTAILTFWNLGCI